MASPDMDLHLDWCIFVKCICYWLLRSNIWQTFRDLIYWFLISVLHLNLLQKLKNSFPLEYLSLTWLCDHVQVFGHFTPSSFIKCYEQIITNSRLSKYIKILSLSCALNMYSVVVNSPEIHCLTGNISVDFQYYVQQWCYIILCMHLDYILISGGMWWKLCKL